ncbi:MAG: DUF2764 domain-containing protein [Candidatus Cloacimonetes bacterium]|jgi:hypothetical protein|nr:DUF2764 domain-containing protein [Candidatus Cloacimonadota bacterium]MCB5286351.1 DUF2764 domain-containing protein [Candidatus Cloacimonadota bacterium]MCK9184048.1 DUF2764 domain-containing protein [Candidatus Cloacimonadota bacterium]MCK9583749.1 DUF2764 domain-containing protein [Candidatus Cloacimonadota bacterium]MDY0228673.1 DUF2764 family protein [Candidatus Cloacimonadaceae bacterium]
MARQYYYFIAGLPTISMDDSKLAITPETFRQDALGQLSEEDYKLLKLLHLPDEISNLLLRLYKNSDKQPNPEGLNSPEYWEEYLDFLRHKADNHSLDTPQEYAYLPTFIAELILAAFTEEELPPSSALEHQLLSHFFDFVCTHPNKFIVQWFELQRNIKNILSAINGRHHELDFAPYLIGEDETVTNLKKSHAADFSLGKDHPFFDQIMRIWEQNNILYRERGYDLLRNKWIDQQNFFEYFNIDRILGYYSKLRIIHRWLIADAELGKEVFHDTLNKLENSFEFPDDFNIRIKQK